MLSWARVLASHHALALGAVAATAALACTPDFDALDPSLGGSSGAGATGSGAAGTGGTGTGGTGATSQGGGGDGPVCEPIVDGDDCTEDICQNGEPANPQKAPGAACNQSGGSVCDESGECIGCFADEHCTMPQTCGGGGVANECGCTPTTCAALGRTCGMVSDGCGAMLDCNNGMDGDETGVDCGGDPSTCPTRCDLGDPCGNATDCTGDFCADGVCCVSACLATCKSCALAGSLGSCANVPEQGVDPGTCVAPMACTGGGGCKIANGQPCTNNGKCASTKCDNPGTLLCIP